MLRAADGGELVLEEWALQQLLRDLPGDLARALRPSTTARDEQTAQAVARALGADHRAHGFFDAAGRASGFQVERG